MEAAQLSTAAAAAVAEAEKARRAQPTVPLGGREGKRITRDGAWDLLEDLEAAYTDPWFVKRVDKLIHDVRFDTKAFMGHLGGVALEAQRPVLEKWGFGASKAGVGEMRAAVQEHTRGPGADPRLQETADRVNRALYGTPSLRMYERVMLGT